MVRYWLQPSPAGAQPSAIVAHIGRYRWTICGLIFLITTLNYMDRQVLALLLPVLQDPVTGGDHVAHAVDVIRKAGTCVLTGLPRAADDVSLPISLRHIVLYQKRLQGSLFGASSPSKEIPALLELYRMVRLQLDELITRRYSLESINDGFEDMRAGRNIRGVVTYPT